MPMILTRFFKPKWQHPNPEVRKQALQELSPADVIRLARQDRSPEVRRAALERITDLEVLGQIASQDTDAQVRQAAAARHRELWSGNGLGSPALSTRIAALPALDGALVEFLAVHAKEAELRLAALERVEQESLLGEAALNDAAATVRFAALDRITDPALLERIAKQSRNRDKRIYRTAQERLDNLRHRQARRLRSEQLCSEMETLTWDGETGLNAGRFPRLEREWQPLEAEAEAAVRERYVQARTRFLARRQESALRRTARQDICVSLERCLERLEAEQELTGELETSVQETLQKAQQDWSGCGGAADDGEGRRLEGRFGQLIHAIGEHERILRRNHERVARLRGILQQAEALLNQPSEVLESDIAVLRQRWTGLERPESKRLSADLQGEFEGLLGKLRARLQRQVEQREQELKEIQALIDALEIALEQGELQQAIALQEQARQRLRHNIGLSRKQMTALEERLHTCLPTLNELRGWRRWGTHQAREHLCEEAQRLVDAGLDPLELAQRIKDLRNAWKALDGTEGAASKALWKRFDRVCEQAYAPCQAYFEAQTRERQHNLAKKQALCERLEKLEAATDWDQVDWHWADRIYREIQKEWRKLGPVNRADKKSLDKRYHTALRHLNAHLKKEREHELYRRQALIREVDDLAQGDDLQAAVEGAKAAQAHWQPTVQASRREEQELWRQFRAACDAVFERRQMEQQAAEEERQANLARKTALCEAIEALAAVDSAGIHQARRRVQEAQEEWLSIGPVPKASYRAIQQRFDKACRQVEQREQELQEEQVRQELRSLRSRGRLCNRLEALLEGELPVDIQALVERACQEWEALLPVKNPCAAPLRQRFDAVCRALAEGPEARQALCRTLLGNLPGKQELCLRMEIVAGLESPPELAKARMELQVARLSESLSNRDIRSEEGPLEEAREIEEEWHLLGALPAAQNTALEARFERALAALEP